MKASYAQIRAFNAVAIEGSFKKAAAILGVSQPAVTLQIRSLEDAYTVVLFKRHRDNAELTVLGQELFAISNPIKLIETEIDDLLTNESALKSGRLTLAAGSPALILPLLKRYNALYPRVELNLRLDNYDAIQAALQKNQVDIAILDGPIKHERLLSKQYLQQELVLVVNRKHRLAKFKFVSPDDVISEVLLMRSDSSYTQKITEAWFRRARLQFESTLRFGNHNSILEAVSLDIGIGFAFSQEVGDNNIIKKIPLRGSSERCIESLVCQKSQYRRGVVRAFFDLVS